MTTRAHHGQTAIAARPTLLRHRDRVGRGFWAYVALGLLLIGAVAPGCGGPTGTEHSDNATLVARRDYAIYLATCGRLHLEAQDRLAASGHQAVRDLLGRLEVGDLAELLRRRFGTSESFFRLGWWDSEGATAWLDAAVGDGELAWACVCALVGERPNFLQRSREVLQAASPRRLPAWVVSAGAAAGACLAARTRLGSAWVCGFPESRVHPPAGSQPIQVAQIRPLLRHPISAVRWLGLRLARAGSMGTGDLLQVLGEQYGSESTASTDSPLEAWTLHEEYALTELVSEHAREDRRALAFLSELGDERTAWALAGLHSRRSLRRGAAFTDEPRTFPAMMMGVRGESDLLDLLADLERHTPRHSRNSWRVATVLHAAAPLCGAELPPLRRLMRKHGESWTEWKETFDCVRLAWILSEVDAADVDRWLEAHWDLVVDVFCHRGWSANDGDLEVANTLAMARGLPPTLGTAILDSIVPRVGGKFQEAIRAHLSRNEGKPLAWPETIGLMIREHGWLRERSWSEQLDFLSALSAEPELCCVLLGATAPSLRSEARRGGVDLASWVERLADPAVRAAARAAWGL